MRSADAKLRDAVRRNDSSLISNDSLNLLTTTLSNWGNMVKNLGIRADQDDDDDDAGNNGNDTVKTNKSSKGSLAGSSKKGTTSDKQQRSGADDNDQGEADAEQFLLSKEQQEQNGEATAAVVTLPGGQEQVGQSALVPKQLPYLLAVCEPMMIRRQY